MTDTAANTPVSAQTPGDCQSVVCDGQGNAKTIPDDTDTPSALPCQLGTCANGVPGVVSQPSETPCSFGGGAVCDGAGDCVDCVSAVDCPSGTCSATYKCQSADAGSTVDAGFGCDGGPANAATAESYSSPGGGACSYDAPPGAYVAVSSAVFDASAACGTCLQVSGPLGSTMVTVTDECVGCTGDFALDATSFAAIADPHAGVVSITWQPTECPANGGIRYQIDNGSSMFYLEIVLSNFIYPVATLEIEPSGAAGFSAMPRNGFDEFTYNPGSAIATPVLFRVTDVFGHVVTESLTTLPAGTTVQGVNQFAATCGP